MRKGLILVTLSFVAGLFFGLCFRAEPVHVIEASAPAVRQSDGSLILERKPDASAVAPMQIPKSAKVERLAKVMVKPRPVASAADHFRAATKMVDCAPVTLDLALVKMPDDSRRMIASSPDGEVVAGFDMPVLPTISVAPPKWSAGLSYSDQRQLGAWLDRDVGRAVVGVAVRQSDRGLRAEARLGWRF